MTVELPSESAHSFRYVAAGDYWFDGESAGDRKDPTAAFTLNGPTGVAWDGSRR